MCWVTASLLPGGGDSSGTGGEGGESSSEGGGVHLPLQVGLNAPSCPCSYSCSLREKEVREEVVKEMEVDQVNLENGEVVKKKWKELQVRLVVDLTGEEE